YNVIGSVSEQEKVVKLWNGFKPKIRANLYREKLNPNISSWNEAVERAELLEVVENTHHGQAGHCTPKNPSNFPGEGQGGPQSYGQNGNKGVCFGNNNQGIGDAAIISPCLQSIPRCCPFPVHHCS
ncbi:hypothetical protein BDN71DRAFT_1393002, partial [Pleurotus eryngii]